ncbi:hypothetical protein MLD52_05180 [Puniceicoccaceae bacterium K14]|nr:hypothetical protein [Puniceicoccaceae bacterium K14]
MKSFRILIYTLIALTLNLSVWAAPEWETRIEPSDFVKFESQAWHEREGYWLFTARLTTTSDGKLKPLTHVAFTALGESEEDVLWVYRKSVRRKDLKSKMGGKYEIFLRVHLKEAPTETTVLKVEFVNQPKSLAEKEAEQ